MMADRTKLARYISLTSYALLLLVLTAVNAWIAPSPHFPVGLVLLAVVLPLLLPLRGLLHGRAYTHAWAGYIALPYIAYGVMEWFSNPALSYYAASLTLLSLVFFISGMAYARWHSRGVRADASS